MSRTHETVAISLHPELRDEARQRAAQLGFGNSFSAYVAKLIAEDLRRADTLRDAPSPGEQGAAATIQHAAAAAQGKPVSYRAGKEKRAKSVQSPQS